MVFRAGAVAEPVRVGYAALQPAGGLPQFDLTATTIADGRAVHTFGVPPEIRIHYDRLRLDATAVRRHVVRTLDDATGQWQTLPVAVDAQAKTLTTWTSHFSTFAQAAGGDCQTPFKLADPTGLTSAEEEVDGDGDPYSPPRYVTVGAYATFSGAFPNYPGTIVTVGGLGGGPVTGAGKAIFDGTTLFAAPMGSGSYSFAGGGPGLLPVTLRLVHDNPSWPQYGLTSQVWLTRQDIQPPEVTHVTLWQDGAGSAVLVVQIDENCPSAGVTLLVTNSDQVTSNTFTATCSYPDGVCIVPALHLPTSGENTFLVGVDDGQGNPQSNAPADLALTAPADQAGIYGPECLVDVCDLELGVGTGSHQGVAQPIDTASGNFVHQFDDLALPGPGESALEVRRTYNSLAALQSTNPLYSVNQPASPFGRGWGAPFGAYLELAASFTVDGMQLSRSRAQRCDPAHGYRAHGAFWRQRRWYVCHADTPRQRRTGARRRRLSPDNASATDLSLRRCGPLGAAGRPQRQRRRLFLCRRAPGAYGQRCGAMACLHL